MRRRSIMPKPVQRVTVPSCLCEVGQKVHPGPTPMAPAVHENYRPRALHGCEWHEALNVHAMNPVLRLIHCKPHLLMSIPKRTTGAIRFANNWQPPRGAAATPILAASNQI